MDARRGDRIVIESKRVGQGRRSGEVTRVEGEGDHQRLWVRWEDGHESLFMPSAGAHVEAGGGSEA